MVILAVEFHQFRFNVRADAGEHRAQSIKDLFCEDFTAVFRYKDQMHMIRKTQCLTWRISLALLIDQTMI